MCIFPVWLKQVKNVKAIYITDKKNENRMMSSNNKTLSLLLGPHRKNF